MGRTQKLAAIIKEGVRNPQKIKKGLKVLKNQGPEIFKQRLSASVNYEPGYGRVKKEKLKNYGGEILFSIVMPVYNIEIKWLDKAIESIEKQNYKNWEICIADDCSTKQEIREHLSAMKNSRIKIKLLEKNQRISGATNAAAALASGEYILLMDNDDELAPSALHEFYQKIKKEGSDIIYSDMDIIDAKGKTRDPLCKPDWSPDLFLSQMYLGHLIGFKKSLFEKVGGFRGEFNGSQDYDLLLRMTEMTDKIGHVPETLYHWRDLPSSTAANPESKPYAQTAGLNAIQEHLDRVYGKGAATANETENLFVYDVRYHMNEEPKVSIIIPIKDHADLLKAAIDSIYAKTTYKNFEIIILNNNSEKEETFSYLKKVEEEHDNVIVKDAAFEFNWSRLNNYGMKFATGDVYVCLNNDVEVIEPEWLTRLVEKAIRKDVGVVGGLLLYEDNTIQHAGVVIGMGGWADHVFKGMKPQHYGSPFVSPMVTRNVSAVTGACLAVSKATIEKIGGFDEKFIVCGSDIELALRANQHGLVNIYDPNVRLYHYESKSRDASKIPQIDFDLSDQMYKTYRKNGDPYYNRNLDYYCCQPKICAATTRLNALRSVPGRP
jgi:O-antigen biosynthesis protein